MQDDLQAITIKKYEAEKLQLIIEKLTRIFELEDDYFEKLTNKYD